MLRWVLMPSALLLVQAVARAAEHRAPDRVAGLALVELEARIELQDLAELLAALALLAGHAVGEREVLVRRDLVALEGEAFLDAALQEELGLFIVGVLVGADPAGEILVRGRADGPRDSQHGTRAASRDQHERQNQRESSARHRRPPSFSETGG